MVARKVQVSRTKQCKLCKEYFETNKHLNVQQRPEGRTLSMMSGSAPTSNNSCMQLKLEARAAYVNTVQPSCKVTRRIWIRYCDCTRLMGRMGRVFDVHTVGRISPSPKGRRTLHWAFLSAPKSSNNRAQSAWSSNTDIHSAVRPSCDRHVATAKHIMEQPKMENVANMQYTHEAKYYANKLLCWPRVKTEKKDEGIDLTPGNQTTQPIPTSVNTRHRHTEHHRFDYVDGS